MLEPVKPRDYDEQFKYNAVTDIAAAVLQTNASEVALQPTQDSANLATKSIAAILSGITLAALFSMQMFLFLFYTKKLMDFLKELNIIKTESSFDMVLRYAHLSGEHLRNAADRISILKPAKPELRLIVNSEAIKQEAGPLDEYVNPTAQVDEYTNAIHRCFIEKLAG